MYLKSFDGVVQETVSWSSHCLAVEAEEHLNYCGSWRIQEAYFTIIWWISASNRPLFSEVNSVGPWKLSSINLILYEFLWKLKNTGSINWWISASNIPLFAEVISGGSRRTYKLYRNECWVAEAAEHLNLCISWSYREHHLVDQCKQQHTIWWSYQ